MKNYAYTINIIHNNLDNAIVYVSSIFDGEKYIGYGKESNAALSTHLCCNINDKYLLPTQYLRSFEH